MTWKAFWSDRNLPLTAESAPDDPPETKGTSMNPQLINAMATSHIDDLRRGARTSHAGTELRGPSRVRTAIKSVLNLRLREPALATAPARAAQA
jgi:hypothetical protein